MNDRQERLLILLGEVLCDLLGYDSIAGRAYIDRLQQLDAERERDRAPETTSDDRL